MGFNALVGHVCLCLFPPVGNQPAPKGSAEPDVQVVLRAKSARAQLLAFQRLLRDRNTAQIRALKTSFYSTIALRAAWEEALAAVGGKFDGAAANSAQANALQRFVGFVGGRLKVVPPDWWEEMVLNIRSDDGVTVWCARPRGRLPYHALNVTNGAGFPLVGPRDTIAERAKEVLKLVVGGKKVTVSSQLIEQRNPRRCLSVVADRERIVAALHDDFGSPFVLRCIERKSAKLLWKAEVWGPSSGGFKFGTSDHFVGLVVGDGRVTVFGAGSYGAHLEGFSTADGANLFRFTTSGCPGTIGE